MPELAGMFIVGAVVVFVLVNWNLYYVHRKFQNPEFKMLNKNLEKISKCWSINQGRSIDIEHSSIQSVQSKDYKWATRSAFLFGTMLIFLSWFGMILFWIYWISVNELAVSREERKNFDSEIVKTELTDLEKIKEIVYQAGT